MFSLLSWVQLFAQYPAINGISTDPANPINNQLPALRNTFFNWQDPNYQVQPINTDCIRGSLIESPFFKIDNLEDLRDSKDMLWEDGWELIRRGFGLDELNSNTVDPVPSLYLILYNKYTGVLRILAKICRGADYNAVKITLKFDQTTTMKTDLLEFSRGDISALDKTFTTTDYATGANYINDNTKWFYADFPMMYDPCTGSYKSKLNIITQLITTSQIALEGSIAGDIYTKDVGGKAEIQNNQRLGWKDVGQFINGKYTQGWQSIGNFKAAAQNFIQNAENYGGYDKAVRKDAIAALSDWMKAKDFLKTGIASVPLLTSAFSLINFFVGGGKNGAATGPTEVKLLPLSVNLQTKLNGNMSTVNQYHDVKFTNPGSKDANLDPSIYPYYNEVLGIFNLIETPSIKWVRSTEKLNSWLNYSNTNADYDVNVDLFKMVDGTFKWVLNPAANLSIDEMKIALVVEGQYTPSYFQQVGWEDHKMSNFTYEGLDATSNGEMFRTNYVNSKDFSRTQFKTFSNISVNSPNTSQHFGLWNVWRPIGYLSYRPTAYLKIMLNLKRNNAGPNTQNILYLVTFPVKLISGSGSMYEQLGNPTTVDPTIISGATVSDVTSFCSSFTYWNPDRQTPQLDSVENDFEPVEGVYRSKIYPNPNSGSFVYKLEPSNSQLISIKIINMTGVTVFNSEEGRKSIINGFTKNFNVNLNTGIYIIVALTNKGTIRSKFVISN